MNGMEELGQSTHRFDNIISFLLSRSSKKDTHTHILYHVTGIARKLSLPKDDKDI